VLAIASSIGENTKAPPSAMPPNADFFKNDRRGFSESTSALAENVRDDIDSGSFNPSFDKIFCAGVMLVFF